MTKYIDLFGEWFLLISQIKPYFPSFMAQHCIIIIIQIDFYGFN